jgi:alpha,alpha-trehalase
LIIQFILKKDAKADFRKDKINELCWNEVSNMYFDYDFVNKKQPFEAATTFFPLGRLV